jgi:hypothetical protein
MVWRHDGTLPIAFEPINTSAHLVAITWAIAGFAAWLRGVFRINDRHPDMSGPDTALDHIRESKRLIRESRNQLRKATGNALEPVAFPRRRQRRVTP